MRTIKISARQARILRENLTGKPEGYEYVELLKLDKLAKELTTLQGRYDERMAELRREERAARRQFVKNESPESRNEADKQLALITFEVQDLHEEAEATPVEFQVSEGEWKLINDRISSVERWTAADDLRASVIGLIDAVQNAESDEAEESEPAGVTKLKRR